MNVQENSGVFTISTPGGFFRAIGAKSAKEALAFYVSQMTKEKAAAAEIRGVKR